MDKAFKPHEWEQKLYEDWEKQGLFHADNTSSKEPFTIILPPPNANADLHLGHAMYVYEDIMIRYKKLQGFEILWMPGADHAGTETQFVFEKHLKKKGKSRFDYDRDTLYKMIWDFVHENRGGMENQLRRLGFALDWSRLKFTLDEDIVQIVRETFVKMYDDGLIYRADRLVNYCTHCGTGFSDLEVTDEQALGKLYHIDFPIDGTDELIQVATTRPETMLGDVAVMVHPTDTRYKAHIGRNVRLPIADRLVPIIADEYVDPEFGTGAVKVTPYHDFNDFEIAKKHKLTHPAVIGFNGRMQNVPERYEGLTVFTARKTIIEELEELGRMAQIKDHDMVLKKCYKCSRVLEPLPMAQWYVKVRSLADRAIRAIEKQEVEFNTPQFKQRATDWLTNFHDWNISRQNVWGIQIPAYRCAAKVISRSDSDEAISSDMQEIATPAARNDVGGGWFVSVSKPEKCKICGECDFAQDTDTFDTWFSSGQWPFAALQTTKEGDFDKFYSTSVMETGYDILPWWVCRMLMLGLYAADKVPFKMVYLHGLVRDMKGQKMSKSKGNVINPLKMIEQYGADALRASLIFEVGNGMDQRLADEKIRAMRNFANKIWNIGRFLHMNEELRIKNNASHNSEFIIQNSTIKDLLEEFERVKKSYHKHMNEYQFSFAFGVMYEFLWHRYADFYIETLKQDLRDGNIEVYNALERVYVECLTMLHPFVPFVTDAAYGQFRKGYILASA